MEEKLLIEVPLVSFLFGALQCMKLHLNPSGLKSPPATGFAVLACLSRCSAKLCNIFSNEL